MTLCQGIQELSIRERKKIDFLKKHQVPHGNQGYRDAVYYWIT